MKKALRKFTFADVLKQRDRERWEKMRKELSVETINKSMLTGTLMHLYIPFQKIDEDQRIVIGVATDDRPDNQDEIVDWDATKEAVADFMKWGNIREMHNPQKAVGTALDAECNEGTHEVILTGKIVDDEAWQKVKEKVYKGFSIGGKAIRKIDHFDQKLGKTLKKIMKYIMTEVSLVDRPANPNCVYTVVKRDNIDPLVDEINLMKGKISTLEKRIINEDKLKFFPDNAFAIIRKRRQGNKIIKERYFPIPDKVHAHSVLQKLLDSPFSQIEKLQAHTKCVKILGKSHDPRSCMFCHQLLKIAKRGGEKMGNREKLMEAQRLMHEAMSGEDNEGAIPAPNYVESEDLRPAEMEADFDPKMKDFEGPNPNEAEGEYYYDPSAEYEEDYDPEDLEGDGVPYEHGEGNERLGYEEGIPEETDRTQVFQDESDYDENQEPLDSEDQEGVYGDGMEGAGCPYCGTTLKLLMTQGLAKGMDAMDCPGCGHIYRINTQPVTTVDGLGNRMAKAEVNALSNEIAKRDAIIAELMEEIETRRGSPQPRKMISKRHISEDQEGNILQASMKKALDMVDIAKRTGKPLTPEDRAFCDKVLDASINQKVMGGGG